MFAGVRESLRVELYKEEEDGVNPGSCCEQIISCCRRTASKMGNFYKGPQDCLCGRSFEQIIAAMFFIYDIYTDYEYIITVPIVNNVMLGFMISTLVIPLVVSFVFAFILPL